MVSPGLWFQVLSQGREGVQGGGRKGREEVPQS